MQRAVGKLSDSTTIKEVVFCNFELAYHPCPTPPYPPPTPPRYSL